MKKVSFEREMGFTRAEFFRILPAAVAGRSPVIDGNLASIAVDEGQLQIYVGDQQYRRIASIRLPYVKVRFTLTGFTQQRVDEVMRYFDLRYQRGGG